MWLVVVVFLYFRLFQHHQQAPQITDKRRGVYLCRTALLLQNYSTVEQHACMHLWFEYLLSHWMLWFFPPACMSCGDLQTGGRNQCVAGEWAFYTSRIVDYLWRLGRSKLLVTVLQILLLYFAHPYRITLNDYKNVIL